MYDLIRLGTSCNQKCDFCFNRWEPINKNLKTKEAKRLIKIYSEKMKYLSFTGGEPTIRSDLSKLINYAVQVGIKEVGIQTNAVRLANKNYTKFLVNKGLSYAFVSLHSHKMDISDALAGTPRNFKKTIRGIKNLLNLGVRIRISHVICLQNYKDLTAFVKFIQNMSPKIEIEFSTVLPSPDIRKNKKIIVKLSEMEPYFYDALTYCKKNNIPFIISSCSVPLCYAQGFEEYSTEYTTMANFFNSKEKAINPMNNLPEDLKIYEEDRGMENWEKNKIKSERCMECSLSSFCNGVWINYAQTFGIDELKPVKNRFIAYHF